jgi:hypothetical protein
MEEKERERSENSRIGNNIEKGLFISLDICSSPKIFPRQKQSCG